MKVDISKLTPEEMLGLVRYLMWGFAGCEHGSSLVMLLALLTI